MSPLTKTNVFLCAALAANEQTEEVGFRAGIVFAASLEDAKQEGLALMKRYYSKKPGWHIQAFHVEEVRRSILERVATEVLGYGQPPEESGDVAIDPWATTISDPNEEKR